MTALAQVGRRSLAGTVGRARDLAGRGARRSWSVARIKAAGLRVRQRHRQLERHPVPAVQRANLAEELAVVMSFRVTSADRLSILETVLDRFEASMASSRVALHVTDASMGDMTERTAALFTSRSLPTSYRQAPESLCESYLRMLRGSDRRFVYLQFDDQLTAGLNEDFLAAACSLLTRYEGNVGVVAILFPWAVRNAEDSGAVEVVTHRVKRRGGRVPLYSFGQDAFRAPVAVERIGSYDFGIFENFTYGFYFNHLVAPTDDYASRLEWYMGHVGENAHQIELAAAGRTLGPYWNHIAVCLNDVSLLDLDFQHTLSAVRPEGHANRATFEALARGCAVRTTHLEV